MKKRHKTIYQRTMEQLEKEGRKHCFLIYGAAGIALHEHYQKGKTAILNFYEKSGEIWRDCAKDNKHSMIQMCYEETGIEIQCGNGKSWEELPYLNEALDKGRYTPVQLVYIRRRQIEWIPAQVMACMIVALHRKYGFGFDRCARFYQQVQEIQAMYDGDAERVRQACQKATGVNVMDIVTERRAAG